MIFVERVILHCDANSYYASVECLYTPSIRSRPVAVCGDPQARHGIVLTKNPLAKSYGVRTGEAIWQARQKCPDLVCVPPDFPLYVRFSERMRRLYQRYSDRVEPFGLDEAWIDLSAPGFTFEDGVYAAHEIRLRMRRELGITISVGVADNKVFAKLGSDLKKPDAVTPIPPDEIASIVWPRPVEELLYVGPSTRRRLAQLNVRTIGDLAHCDERALLRRLGKNGATLKRYACGQDRSPVRPTEHVVPAKSIGNSTTPPHDLQNMDDARCLFYLLAESVAARLRQSGVRARCVSIHARDVSLVTRSAQRMLPRPSYLTDDLASAAMSLFGERFSHGFPYRSVGLSCSMLSPDDEPVQLDFTGEAARLLHAEDLEHAIDGLRRRFGHRIVQRGVVLSDAACARIDPVEDHTIHPVPFYSGQA